jgi:hypothetical protein
MSAKLIPAPRIEEQIFLIRGQKVILDLHLAELYGVEPRTLNQAVKRNIGRFPEDFMFQLSKEETALLMRSHVVTAFPKTSQIATSSRKSESPLRSQFVISKGARGGRRYRPFAFTEQGVAMLSSVLHSPRAVQVNIEIMRAFVRLRQWLASHAELAARLEELEKRYDRKFKIVFEAIRQLMAPSKPVRYPKHREIGFHTLRESMRERKAATRRTGAAASSQTIRY